jgi:hypothetical protein
MTRANAKQAVLLLTFLGALSWPTVARAQIEVGTWVEKSGAMPGMTMTVETCCGTSAGRRITYRMGGQVVMILDSKMDGSDAQVIVGGKATGETMAIKRIDTLHATSVMRMNGKPMGSNKVTLSADGKTLTIENDMSAGGEGKNTEVWIKK